MSDIFGHSLQSDHIAMTGGSSPSCCGRCRVLATFSVIAARIIAAASLPIWILACLTILSHPVAAQKNDTAQSSSAADYDQIQTLIDAMRRRLEKMERTAQESDDALAFLNTQVKGAVERLDSRQAENAARRQRTATLTGELDDAGSSRDDISLQLARVRTDRDILAVTLAEKERVSAGELTLQLATVASLQDSIGAVTEELRAARHARATIDRKLRAARRQLADRNRRLEVVDAERRESQLLRREQTELQARVKELSASLGASQEALTGTLARNDALWDQLSSSRDEIEWRQSVLLEARKTQETLQADVLEKSTEIATLRREVHQRGARIDDLRKRIDAAESKRRALQSELDAKQQRLRKLIAEAERLEHMRRALEVRLQEQSIAAQQMTADHELRLRALLGAVAVDNTPVAATDRADDVGTRLEVLILC